MLLIWPRFYSSKKVEIKSNNNFCRGYNRCIGNPAMKYELKITYEDELLTITHYENNMEISEIQIDYEDGDYNMAVITGAELCFSPYDFSIDFDYENFPKNLRRFGKNKIVLKLVDDMEAIQIKTSEIKSLFLYSVDEDTGLFVPYTIRLDKYIY